MRFAVSLPILLLVAASVAAKSSSQPLVQAPVQNQTALAVYVPPAMLTSRSFIPRLGFWVEPGRALSEALHGVGARYFPAMQVVPGQGDKPYSLLLDLEPKWSAESGKLRLTVKYAVYGTDRSKLLEGSADKSVPIKSGNLNASASAASLMAMQHVMADVQARLHPEPERFPATGSTSGIDYAPLVNHEKPLRTGTAFYINKAGQLLTAAHISRDCALLEAHEAGVSFVVTAKASSDLLDVTVLDSGRARNAGLPLREGQTIELGESVTSVGYPLQGLLGDSPNLTRGNVSASKGIRGSLGLFQFSAPIQPGNSGGPIVSDRGELLGMAVSTLNAESLAKSGLIPQNVNFALDGRHVAAFLRRQAVPFDILRTDGAGSMQTANQAALSNTVQLNCYQ